MRRPMPQMVDRNCKGCSRPFKARAADVKRGWGLFCSKSCKAMKQVTTVRAATNTQASSKQRRPPAWIAGMFAGRSRMFDPHRHRFEESSSEEFSDAHLFSNEDHDCNKD